MAYRKAASVQNAVSGFSKAGLWSLTIDSDFAAATVTNVIKEAHQEHNPMPPLTPAVALVTAQKHNPTPPLTVASIWSPVYYVIAEVYTWKCLGDI